MNITPDKNKSKTNFLYSCAGDSGAYWSRARVSRLGGWMEGDEVPASLPRPPLNVRGNDPDVYRASTCPAQPLPLDRNLSGIFASSGGG